MRERLSTRATFIFLITAIIIGLFMRIAHLKENLFFAYEQGRDMLAVKKIVDGDLTLIGPRTSIEGVFHGPLYYYLMVPFYLLFSGDPIGMMVPFIFFGVGCIYLSYLVGKRFFNQDVGVIAALLYGTSYGAIVYSRWLSHPPLASFFTLLLFYSLYRLITGDSKFVILSIIAFAGIFQLEIVAALSFLPAIVVILFLFRPIVKDNKIKIISFLIAAFSFSPYYLFDLRHNFLVTKSFLRFISNKQSFYHLPFGEILKTISRRYLEEFELMVSPRNRLLVICIIFGIFLLLIRKIKNLGIFSKKALSEKVLILWLISTPHLGLFIWGGFSLKHYMVGMAPGMIMATAFFIYWLMNKKIIWWIGMFLFIFLLINNWHVWRTWLPANKAIFYVMSIQRASLLGQEKRVIDYIYKETKGRKFSWQAFSIPYEMEHVWKYLFWQHGQRKYHYLPAHTNSQLGYFYLILEPGRDPDYRQNWIKNKMGEAKPLRTAEFGSIVVESYLRE